MATAAEISTYLFHLSADRNSTFFSTRKEVKRFVYEHSREKLELDSKEEKLYTELVELEHEDFTDYELRCLAKEVASCGLHALEVTLGRFLEKKKPWLVPLEVWHSWKERTYSMLYEKLWSTVVVQDTA